MAASDIGRPGKCWQSVMNKFPGCHYVARGDSAVVKLVIYRQGSEYILSRVSIYLRMTMMRCDKLPKVAVYSTRKRRRLVQENDILLIDWPGYFQELHYTSNCCKRSRDSLQ